MPDPAFLFLFLVVVGVVSVVGRVCVGEACGGVSESVVVQCMGERMRR